MATYAEWERKKIKICEFQWDAENPKPETK